MPKTPFVWKAELGGAPDSAFSAQLGDVTYYAVTRSYGHPAFVEAHGMRGGLKRLVLGNYVKLEQAKQACERHYRGGCDLVTRRGSARSPPRFALSARSRSRLIAIAAQRCIGVPLGLDDGPREQHRPVHAARGAHLDYLVLLGR